MRRGGMTLMELVVVLAILGAVAVVAAPAIPRRTASTQEPIRAAYAAVRAEAVAHGRPATKVVRGGVAPVVVTGWPSGLVMIDSGGRSRIAGLGSADAKP